MDTKQTAVDWLQEQMIISNFLVTKRLFNQAKQMEKEQIKDAYLASTIQFANDARMDYPKLPEQYYNETYGKDNG
jgi:hypothetical protein